MLSCVVCVGAVVLKSKGRDTENGCKPFCDAACAELGLFRISIEKVRRSERSCIDE